MIRNQVLLALVQESNVWVSRTRNSGKDSGSLLFSFKFVPSLSAETSTRKEEHYVSNTYEFQITAHRHAHVITSWWPFSVEFKCVE
jgi:hypothetical protein